MEIRKDIRCNMCLKDEGLGLLYYKKSYRDLKYDSFISPTLICDACQKEFTQHSDILSEGRPVVWSWVRIARTDMKLWMWLSSNKGKEYNDMASKIWRTKLLRLKKIAEGRRKSWIIQMPMAI